MLRSCTRIFGQREPFPAKGYATAALNSRNKRCPVNTPKSGYIHIENLQLHWGRTGNGPHVVLGLPGLAGSYECDIVPLFEKMDGEQFTMIGWDPPGYGKSRPPHRDILNTEGGAFRRDAHLAAKLMEMLGYARYSLVGQGCGGATAAILASSYPKRVDKLVMYSAPKFSDRRMVQTAEMMKDLNFWTPAQQKRMMQTYGSKYLKKMLGDFEEYTRRAWTTREEAERLDQDLEKIAAPTLVLYGNKDPVCLPRHAEDFHRVIPNSRLHEIRDGTHDHLEVLDEFVSVTSRFLLENRSQTDCCK